MNTKEKKNIREIVIDVVNKKIFIIGSLKMILLFVLLIFSTINMYLLLPIFAMYGWEIITKDENG